MFFVFGAEEKASLKKIWRIILIMEWENTVKSHAKALGLSWVYITHIRGFGWAHKRSGGKYAELEKCSGTTR